MIIKHNCKLIYVLTKQDTEEDNENFTCMGYINQKFMNAFGIVSTNINIYYTLMRLCIYIMIT